MTIRQALSASLISSLLPLLTFATAEDLAFGLRTYVSRPDIVSPTWKIDVFDEAALSPGYWFVSPYEKNGNRQPGGAWIGPHIYDDRGELVWQGSALFNNINVMDFKVVEREGADMLSMIYPVEGNGYILDHHYETVETVEMGVTGKTLNMHDFHTVENGSKYLYLQRNLTEASKELSAEIGYDGECSVAFPGFEERDIKTGELLYKWDATGNLPLTDSTMDFGPVEDRCKSHWDYLHSNAVDKFADGNYLISTRHSDTIYKISALDGSILWRLHGHGGPRSDFTMNNLNFSRQHHARIRSENSTTTILTFLDNALGADHQKATSAWTRALRIALRTDVSPMTATLLSSYDHPKHRFAFRRGSFQPLPDNANAFICWSEHALQSEHAADGTLLQTAELQYPPLGTYRAFKFPWTARPTTSPDVVAACQEPDGGPLETATWIHMSWNGATEVKSWNVWKTDSLTGNGNGRKVLLASVDKQGFETEVVYGGYAAYVFVEAVDAENNTLSRSRVVETTPPANLSSPAVEEEKTWLAENDSNNNNDGAAGQLRAKAQAVFFSPLMAFVGGVVCGLFGFAGAVVLLKRRAARGGVLPSWFPAALAPRRMPGGQKYTPVDPGEAESWDETKLRRLKRGDHGMNGVNGRKSGGVGDEGEEDFVLDSEEEEEEGADGEVEERRNGRAPYLRQAGGV